MPPLPSENVAVELARKFREPHAVVGVFDLDPAHHEWVIVRELNLEKLGGLWDFEKPVLVYAYANDEAAMRLGWPTHPAER